LIHYILSHIDLDLDISNFDLSFNKKNFIKLVDLTIGHLIVYRNIFGTCNIYYEISSTWLENIIFNDKKMYFCLIADSIDY